MVSGPRREASGATAAVDPRTSAIRVAQNPWLMRTQAEPCPKPAAAQSLSLQQRRQLRSWVKMPAAQKPALPVVATQTASAPHRLDWLP